MDAPGAAGPAAAAAAAAAASGPAAPGGAAEQARSLASADSALMLGQLAGPTLSQLVGFKTVCRWRMWRTLPKLLEVLAATRLKLLTMARRTLAARLLPWRRGSELTAPAASNPQPPSTIIPGAWPEPAVVTTGEAEDSSSGTEPPGWGRRTETAAPGEAAAAAGGRLLERLGAQVQNLSAELHSTTERLHAAVARPKSSSAVSEPVKRRKYTDRPQTAAEMAEKHRRERKNFKEKKRRERRQAERSG